MVRCTFCNKDYKTKYSLHAHQKRPSCLKNKLIITDTIVHNCNVCDKVFSTKRNMVRHKTTCKAMKVVESKELSELRERCTQYEEQIYAYRREIKEKDALIMELQKRPTTIINNDNRVDNRKINITIRNYIKDSPECVMLENIKKYIPKLTIGHILGEGSGYAKFFLDEMSKTMRMITKNEARGIVVYKDEDSKIYKDVCLRKFIQIFAQAINKPAKDLMNIFISQLNIDKSTPDGMATLRKYMNYISDLNIASKGNKPNFAPAMVKGITAGTLATNLFKYNF